MKKYYFPLLMMAVVLLSACSKVPEYAKVIPDDAMVVVRIDAKQLAEKSGVGENEKAKKKLSEALKDADLSRSMRDKLEDLMEDPSSAGINLAEPIFFYAAQDGSHTTGGVVGSVSSKDDLTDLLNGLAKETDGDKVVEEKEYSYFAEGRECLVFSDGWFYFGERKWDEDTEDYADDINSLFAKGAKGSIVETDDFQKMCGAGGVAQMLISGKGLTEMREFKDVAKMMPEDLDFEDVAYLMDLTVDNGEASLITEVLPKSDEWKEYMAKYDGVMGDISGELLQYVQKEGFAMFGNVKGEALYAELKDLGVFKNFEGDERDMFKSVLTSLNGDIAIGATDVNMQNGIPTLVAYMQTKDNAIVNVFARQQRNNMEQKASNQYVIPVANDASGQPVSMGFGFKNKISYIVTGANPKEFATPKDAFTKSDLKGKKFYAYFGFSVLKKFSDAFGSDGQLAINGLTKLCDFVELYYEGNGKSVLRLVTKDKDVTPLSALISYAIDTIEKMGKGESFGMTEAPVDSIAVDAYDYAEADTVAAW